MTRNIKVRLPIAALIFLTAVVFLAHQALVYDVQAPVVFQQDQQSERQYDMMNVVFPIGPPSKWQLARMKYANLDTSKVAALLELRRDAQIVPLLLHMMDVLDDDWPFRVYHSFENADLFTARLFRNHIKSGKLTLIQMNVDLTHKQVSNFLAHRPFWDNLAPATHVLLFQTDSIICSRSDARVEDFFEYDFVGAPIHERFHGELEDKFMNGGFSLRNREMILKVIDSFLPFSDPDNDIFEHEDQFFARRMRELGANLPPREVAMQFSVESVYYPTPLGVHQATRYLDSPADASRIHSLQNDWCPEMHLLYIAQGPDAFVCDTSSKYYNWQECADRSRATEQAAATPAPAAAVDEKLSNEETSGSVPLSPSTSAEDSTPISSSTMGTEVDTSRQDEIDVLLPHDSPDGMDKGLPTTKDTEILKAEVDAIDDAPFTYSSAVVEDILLPA